MVVGRDDVAGLQRFVRPDNPIVGKFVRIRPIRGLWRIRSAIQRRDPRPAQGIVDKYVALWRKDSVAQPPKPPASFIIQGPLPVRLSRRYAVCYVQRPFHRNIWRIKDIDGLGARRGPVDIVQTLSLWVVGIDSVADRLWRPDLRDLVRIRAVRIKLREGNVGPSAAVGAAAKVWTDASYAHQTLQRLGQDGPCVQARRRLASGFIYRVWRPDVGPGGRAVPSLFKITGGQRDRSPAPGILQNATNGASEVASYKSPSSPSTRTRA